MNLNKTLKGLSTIAIVLATLTGCSSNSTATNDNGNSTTISGSVSTNGSTSMEQAQSFLLSHKQQMESQLIIELLNELF